MKISIGNDHAGTEHKKQIENQLQQKFLDDFFCYIGHYKLCELNLI